MPRYYFHVYNGTGPVFDEEGTEVPNLDEAREFAVSSIRSIISAEARDGSLDLRGRIEVADANATVCLIVQYAEAFDLHLPGAQR